MLKQTVNEALNKQMNAEFYAAWLYLSMAGWCREQNWNGFSRWLVCQSHEECEHGMRIFQYIDQRNGQYMFDLIPSPNNDWLSLKTVFEAALAHEKSVTQNFDELALLAKEEHDRATVVFLNWFITEQVEEEKQVDDILRHLETFKDAFGAIYLLDKELGNRKCACLDGWE